MSRRSDVSQAAAHARSPDGLGYRPGLDGVRALAITMVILQHTGFELVPAARDWLFPAGFLGVDLFFVLSGFLITTLLLERRTREPQPIRRFYVRRAFRLLPAVLVLLLANIAYAVITGHGVHRAITSLPVVGAYVTNWATTFSFGISFELQHLWSLAVEEQFYLVWPVVLFAGLRLGLDRRRWVLVIAGLALAAAVWQRWLVDHGHPYLEVYVRTDGHADALLVGCGLAVLPWERIAGGLSPRVAALAGAAAAAFVVAGGLVLQYTSPVLYSGGFLLVALAGAVLVLVALRPGHPLQAVLAWVPVVAVGRLSYSLYLWHWPVFAAVSDHTGDWPAGGRLVLGWVLMAVLSIASFRLVERPGNRLGHSLARRRSATRAAVLAEPAVERGTV
jgi:peptidoglycan/LPS O-acetylase OafA/YrhL